MFWDRGVIGVCSSVACSRSWWFVCADFRPGQVRVGDAGQSVGCQARTGSRLLVVLFIPCSFVFVFWISLSLWRGFVALCCSFISIFLVFLFSFGPVVRGILGGWRRVCAEFWSVAGLAFLVERAFRFRTSNVFVEGIVLCVLFLCGS